MQQVSVFNAAAHGEAFAKRTKEDAKRVLLSTLMQLAAIPDEKSVICRVKDLRAELVDALAIGADGEKNGGMPLP